MDIALGKKYFGNLAAGSAFVQRHAMRSTPNDENASSCFRLKLNQGSAPVRRMPMSSRVPA